jgi:hypothetical protein
MIRRKHTMMSKLSLSVLAMGLTMLAATARAGVININATANGEQIGDGSCNPCNGALIAPVQVILGPGSYTITDAWSTTSGLEPGALYDAWNFEAGNGDAWVWHWKLLSDDGSDGSTITPANYASFLLFDVDSTQEFTTELAAATLGAGTAATDLVIASTTTLDFVVNDYGLSDNAGGVSLDIECTSGACLSATTGVPEPASIGLTLAGLVGLAMAWRQRRAAIA